MGWWEIGKTIADAKRDAIYFDEPRLSRKPQKTEVTTYRKDENDMRWTDYHYPGCGVTLSLCDGFAW